MKKVKEKKTKNSTVKTRLIRSEIRRSN